MNAMLLSCVLSGALPFATLPTPLPAQQTTPLTAQLTIGQRAPTPHWGSWLQGAAVAFAATDAPVGTVYASYVAPGRSGAFASDGGYLAALQQRFGPRGLSVVAIVLDKVESMDTWVGCSIVTDADAATSRAWLSIGEDVANVVVCDRDGLVRFVGRPEAGLVDAIETTLSGRAAAAVEARTCALRDQLIDTFDDLEAAPAVQRLQQVLEHAPHDGVSLGLLYLARSTKANDAAEADQALSRALEQLAAEPRPLAAFADLALRGDPRREGLAARLLVPLRAAAKSTARDVVVQLAYLRALAQTGDGREVARTAIRLRKLVLADAMQCIEFATILTQDHEAPIHRDLATMTIDQAERLGVTPRLLAAARYCVAVRCADDKAGAEQILDGYVGDTERVNINNDCWYLMTKLPTMGRFDAFAAGLADRMLRDRDGMDYFEFDTAALAMFLAGRHAEAVQLQELAVQRGGGGNREYLERLERYRHAAQPAPR